MNKYININKYQEATRFADKMSLLYCNENVIVFIKNSKFSNLDKTKQNQNYPTQFTLKLLNIYNNPF